MEPRTENAEDRRWCVRSPPEEQAGRQRLGERPGLARIPMLSVLPLTEETGSPGKHQPGPRASGGTAKFLRRLLPTQRL